METSRRIRMTVSLPEYAVADMKRLAQHRGWSLSALAGEYILDAMYQTPSADTLQAIEEARSGAKLPAVDTSSTEAFVQSIMQ